MRREIQRQLYDPYHVCDQAAGLDSIVNETCGMLLFRSRTSRDTLKSVRQSLLHFWSSHPCDIHRSFGNRCCAPLHSRPRNCRDRTPHAEAYLTGTDNLTIGRLLNIQHCLPNTYSKAVPESKQFKDVFAAIRSLHRDNKSRRSHSVIDTFRSSIGPISQSCLSKSLQTRRHRRSS